MIESYLGSAIRQTRERAKLLKGKIPHPVKAAELVSLQCLCENRIDAIIGQLDYLLVDRTILLRDLIKERIRIFRRINDEVSQLETTAIAALTRVHDDDIFMNKLVFQIHHEINFPLSPPAVSCLSRDYFSINPSLHLLEVPLAESDFLLHLPDLYHEVAHLLIAATNNPKVEPFQKQFSQFLSAVADHFESERETNLRSTGPTAYFGQVLDLLERYWINWATEMFCDLFATYTVGPAFVWAHFHLTALHEGDPFDVRLTRLMSHPPDQARMEAMLFALAVIGFSQEAEAIKQEWDALVCATGATQEPLYRKACPRSLLQLAADCAFAGTESIGCRITKTDTRGKVHDVLNTAWHKFWNSPNEYAQWERDSIAQLKQP